MKVSLPKVDTTSHEVFVEMKFEVPRELLYKAFLDPMYLSQWWGPEGFTAPTIKIDPRVGGKYLFCMRDAEGRDFWSTGVIKELVYPERIVYTDSFSDPEGNPVPASYYGMGDDSLDNLLVTISLAEVEDGTKLTLRQVSFPSAEMAAMTADSWRTLLGKLANIFKKEK